MRRCRCQKAVGGTGGGTIAVCGGVDCAPLSVIEDVECLCAELEVHAFTNSKVLEQTHVEVCASGKVENVATRVAVSKPLRRGKGITVVETRAELPAGMSYPDLAVDVSNDVRIGLNGTALAGGE